MADKPIIEAGTAEAVAFKLWDALRGISPERQAEDLAFFRKCLDAVGGPNPKP